MKVIMTSPLTGITHTQDIDVTEAQFEAWQNGELIQNAMPNLTPSEREFIKTGITNEEWDKCLSDNE